MIGEIIKWGLLGFMIIAPTVAVYFRNTAGAAILAAVGAGAILLTRLPDISAFELLALKVKLERQSEQVEVTLQQLQAMAAAFAQANLTQLAMSGHMLVGLETKYKFELHDSIIASLKNIKLSDDDINKAQQVWITIYCSMLLDSIESSAKQLLPDVKVVDEIESLPKDSDSELPSPKTVRNWITSRSLHDMTLAKLVDEYANVWTTGTMKDPQLIPFNQSFRGSPRH